MGRGDDAQKRTRTVFPEPEAPVMQLSPGANTMDCSSMSTKSCVIPVDSRCQINKCRSNGFVA